MARIENIEQYNWAIKRVEELLPLVNDNTPLSNSNSIELEILSNLVADYSEEHFTIGEPTLVDMLKLRMYEMDLSQIKLGKLLGISNSRINDYLNGRSEPTLSVARKIKKELNIDAEIILGS